MSTKQIANTGADSPAARLRKMLEASKEQIALALPRHVTPERMIRMALTVFNRTPGLQDCEPVTVLACIIQASELGLELSGPLGHAWMVPYRNNKTGTTEAQFQVGYRGFIDLAFRSGKLSSFVFRTVYANDFFEVEYGSQQRIIHRPAMKDRGDAVGYYACINMKDGGHDFEYLSKDDALKHMDRYAKGTTRSDSPWRNEFDAMAMKTCVRRLAKRVPLSAELQTAVTHDEYAEAAMRLAGDVITTPALPAGRVSLRRPVEEQPAPDYDLPQEEPSEEQQVNQAAAGE